MSVNFKSVVSSLIDTLMKKSVANVSPGSVFSTVHIASSGQQVVSPCDGFIAGSIGTKNMNDAYFRIGVSNMSHTHESLTSGYYSTMHIPVKKGDSVTCQFAGFSDTPYLNFVQRIGGGLNQILQAIGGGLCHLRHSFNRFSSYQAGKRTQTATCFKSMARLVATPLRAMALFCSAHHQSKDESHLSMHGERFPSQATALQNAPHVLQSRVLKANLFSGHMAERLTFMHLPHPRARLNLACEGGAL